MKYQVLYDDVAVGDPWPTQEDAIAYAEALAMDDTELVNMRIVPVLECASNDYQLASMLSH